MRGSRWPSPARTWSSCRSREESTWSGTTLSAWPSPYGVNWPLRAFATCADPLAGLVRRTAVSPFGPLDLEEVMVSCQAGETATRTPHRHRSKWTRSARTASRAPGASGRTRSAPLPDAAATTDRRPALHQPGAGRRHVVVGQLHCENREDTAGTAHEHRWTGRWTCHGKRLRCAEDSGSHIGPWSELHGGWGITHLRDWWRPLAYERRQRRPALDLQLGEDMP